MMWGPYLRPLLTDKNKLNKKKRCRKHHNNQEGGILRGLAIVHTTKSFKVKSILHLRQDVN